MKVAPLSSPYLAFLGRIHVATRLALELSSKVFRIGQWSNHPVNIDNVNHGMNYTYKFVQQF